MLRVDLRKARPGMSLALPVMNPRLPGHVLLKTGYALTPDVIEKLEDLSVRTVWVAYPSLSFLEKYIDRDAIEKQGHVVSQIRDTFEALQTESNAKLDYDTYTRGIGNLVESVIANPNAAIFVGDLSHHDDNQHMLRQSSAVTYLSLLIGLKLEGYLIKQRRHVAGERAKEVTNLGVGAMLHDIGVTFLPQEVVERYEQTGDETDPAWREHPALGYQVVRGKVDPTAAAVVLHHHQRFDGTGYAGKDYPVQSGESIHIFPRIVAVADLFTRLRRPPGQPERPAAAVLRAMLSEKVSSRFDPNLLRGLIEVVPPYPPGSFVKLSSGATAVVIDHNLADPCRPTVQMLPGDELPDDDVKLGPTINLSEQIAELQIIACDDVPTHRFNFTPDEIPGFREAVLGWA
ncbi:MAG: HD domain-containing phosphohydrolase [Planctomycetota bacterium]